MSSAANAQLEYESSQTPSAMAALTDGGDHKVFSNAASYWSQKSGYTPDIKPNGLLTGGGISPAAGQDDKIDVAALTLNLNGIVTAVAGSSGVSISRGLTTDTHRITSITVNAAGSIVAVPGTDGAAFSETRGADGGPPFIPVDSVEIGQVRVTSVTAGQVTSDEIYAEPGTHLERANFPTYTVDARSGSLTFRAALPLIHTGSLPKKVFAKTYEPVFTAVDLADAFTPPERTNSVSSTQVYGGAIGSVSSSLSQGSFTAYLEDGATDDLVGLKGEVLFFRFYPDRNKTPFLYGYGTLGVGRQFPANGQITASCTISSQYEFLSSEG